MNGILNILKPPGMTSHDVVSFARRLLGTKKIGHTGTLDPGVAGVMVLCVGKATRLVEYLLDSGKAYRCELTLGKATDTQDAFGQVVSEKKSFLINHARLEEVIEQFRGKIQQVPPMYSAVRHQGKKLYELARTGQEVERRAREVEIKSLQILNCQNFINSGLTFDSKVIFDVECSKGTYIRTLCADIGEKLGCGAYMSYLVRTAVGKFFLKDSWSLEELKNLEGPSRVLQAMTPSILGLSEIVVNEKGQEKLSHGIAIQESEIVEMKSLGISQKEVAVSNTQGELIAIAQQRNSYWQPIKVLC